MSQKTFNQGQDFVLGLLLTSDKEKNNKLLKKSSNCMRKNVQVSMIQSHVLNTATHWGSACNCIYIHLYCIIVYDDDDVDTDAPILSESVDYFGFIHSPLCTTHCF